MNVQQQRFVDAYLTEAKGNGTKAAIIAGYSEKTASVQASQLLRKPTIKAAVERTLQKADLRTQARLDKLGVLADATPEAITAGDVIRANELILKVNGALKDKTSDNRITVNIGFLQANQPPRISIETSHDGQLAETVEAEVLTLAHQAVPDSPQD